MKLGIIGAGMIVKMFLPELVKMEGLEVAGMMSTKKGLENAGILARENGISFVTSDFEELCRAGIDTVYVAVPNFLHFDYCVKALEKKLNVIVEKPMTSNIGEAEKLKALAVENQCFLFEAITTTYLGNYQKIREWLPEIGSIKLAKSEFCQYSSRYDAFLAGEVLPVFDPQKSGGALMDLNLYNLHYIMGLFGVPVEYKYYANVERGIDTSGVLVMQYPDFTALCIAAKDSRGTAGGMIQGTKGVIRSRMAANSVGEVTLELNNGTVETYDDGMGAKRMIPEFTAFLRAIRDNDWKYCYKRLDESIAVSRVQTKARLDAGIVFAADESV